jgi:hydrogenase-1 operon protein HyaF
MAFAVLAEIGRLLAALADSGATGAIDLRSLPLTAADRDQLQALLGQGEVRAELDLAGLSEVWETAFPGAWWIRHLGADGRVAAEVIAICPVPEILAAHPADVRAGARRLSRKLEQHSGSEPPDSGELVGDMGDVGGRSRPTEAKVARKRRPRGCRGFAEGEEAAPEGRRACAPTALEKPHG